MDTEKTGVIFDMVCSELSRATAKHGPINSHHEAYAIILEELDEYWEEVRKQGSERNLENMRGELVQIAAMAIRAYYDLCQE